MTKPKSTDEKVDDGRFWFGQVAVNRLDFVLNRCESPVEQLLCIKFFGLPHVELVRGFYSDEDPFAEDGEIKFYLQRRVQVGGKEYRLDFAVLGRGKRVAVEVDGHEFHERTKEQAKRDKSRDRALTTAGWRVLRFTGSEVWEDADECAWQVLRAIYPELNEVPE